MRISCSRPGDHAAGLCAFQIRSVERNLKKTDTKQPAARQREKKLIIVG
jgi:hypothetical protein